MTTAAPSRDEQAGFGGALPAGAAADEGNFTLQSHNGIS